MPNQNHHWPRERLLEKSCFIDHFVTQGRAQQIHQNRAKPNQAARQQRELVYPSQTGQIGHPALSPRGDRRSTSNRNILIRTIFLLLEGGHTIGHPAIVEFSFVLLGEDKNIGHLPSVGGNEMNGDPGLIVFHF